MSNRFQTLSFTTDAIDAGTSLEINRNVGPNWLNIYKIKITPSTTTSPLRAEFYSRNTFLAADRIGGYSISVSGPIIDPMENTGSGPVDKGQRGFVFPYDDLNGFGQLHIKVYNDHTIAQNYDIEIIWEPRFYLSAGSTLTLTPGNTSGDISVIQVVNNTSTQKVKGSLTTAGTVIGTRQQINFIASDRISISAADNVSGDRVDYTFTAANQIAADQALIWALQNF